jgi:hypothetical protein
MLGERRFKALLNLNQAQPFILVVDLEKMSGERLQVLKNSLNNALNGIDDPDALPPYYVLITTTSSGERNKSVAKV